MSLKIYGIKTSYLGTPTKADFVCLPEKNYNLTLKLEELYTQSVNELKSLGASPFYGSIIGLSFKNSLRPRELTASLQDIKIENGDYIIMLGGPCPH